MNKFVLILLLLVLVLVYGGYYYRDYFVAPEPEIELPLPLESDSNNDDPTSDIEPVQMDQFLDFDNLDSQCDIAATCGDLVGVNCRAEVDGPYYYAKKDTGKIVAYCGGYCMTMDCTNTCPPKEWTCN